MNRTRRYAVGNLIGHTLNRILYGFASLGLAASARGGGRVTDARFFLLPPPQLTATATGFGGSSGSFMVSNLNATVVLRPRPATGFGGSSGSFMVSNLNATVVLRPRPAAGSACFTREPALVQPIFQRSCGP